MIGSHAAAFLGALFAFFGGRGGSGSSEIGLSPGQKGGEPCASSCGHTPAGVLTGLSTFVRILGNGLSLRSTSSDRGRAERRRGYAAFVAHGVNSVAPPFASGGGPPAKVSLRATSATA